MEVNKKVIRVVVWGSSLSQGRRSFLYSPLKGFNLVIILLQ